MMEAIVSGIAVGFALGLTGGGGSILAVPLLLYVLGLDLRAAVKASLAVVGLTSLLGAFLQYRQVMWRAGLVLGIGGVLGSPVGAGLGTLLPDDLTLLLFSALMIFIAVKFWRGAGATEVPLSRFSCPRGEGEAMPQFKISCAGKLIVAGSLAGVLAGLFGVGGGFLLVPALMLVAGLPIKTALATSLLSIAILSAAGFVANQAAAGSVDLPVILRFMGGSFLGMATGSWLKQFIPVVPLKRAFAITVLTMAAAVIFQTLRSF